MEKKDLIERLLRLDEDADLMFDDAARFHLVIVGGGALILLDRVSRATLDVDVLDASREIRGLLEKYDINCRVQTYINNFPYNYEDRLIHLPLETRKIDFFTASLEDIVVAKLFSFRPTDQADVECPEVLRALDWELLEHLATDENEARASALNDSNYRAFKENYDDYVRRWRPCGN